MDDEGLGHALMSTTWAPGLAATQRVERVAEALTLLGIAERTPVQQEKLG